MASQKKSETETSSPEINSAWAKLIKHLLSQLRAGHFKNIPGSELTEEDLLSILESLGEKD